MAAVAEEWHALEDRDPSAALQLGPVRPGDVFEVIGGRDVGGIKVREGKDLSSPEALERLAPGAFVQAVEAEGSRLRFELLEGSGPASGWVSLRAAGKELLLRVSRAPSDGANAAIVAGGGPLSKAALQYGLRFHEAAAAAALMSGKREDVLGTRTSFPLWSPGPRTQAAAAAAAGGHMKVGLDRDLEQEQAGAAKWGRSALDDQVVMCHQCKLPVGQVAYTAGGKSKAVMHGECMAQHMLREMRDEEAARRGREAEVKAARRAEYEIGWRPERLAVAVAREESGASGGMRCLALDEGSAPGSLKLTVAPTLEPGAAVNLEYLSIALRVRRQEGREPLFSLDPADPTRSAGDDVASMQVKRFEPEWLAGTSVGEVMFQADYHLKELSMGEYDQPVVGMRSCFDLCREESFESEWSAREWFVVRNAEVHLSSDSALVPFVRLGVEAREQILGPQGLEDATLTRHDHPLVRYAEDFTKNFDLIAERKSVVHQLREVAKASVLAKFLLESGTPLEESWFGLADGMETPCCLEVPQLWHDRYYSEVQVLGGAIVDTGRKQKDLSRRHGVYGGIDFGIDRFRLAAPSRVAAPMIGGRVVLSSPASTLMAAAQQPLTLAPPRAFARLAGPLSAAPLSVEPSRIAASLTAPISGMSMAGALRAPAGAVSASTVLRAPQGVDLNLEQFNLSEPTMASGGEVRAREPSDGVPFGSALLACLEPKQGGGAKGAAALLGAGELGLWKGIFNPNLSDRWAEGEAFQPPPTGAAHLRRLQELLSVEDEVRAQRKAHFLSSAFLEDSAGPLFPSSWTSSFQGQVSNAHSGMLQARHDFCSESPALVQALRTSPPAFERLTEDGTKFRIYRFGSLEIRTTQDIDEEEEVGAAFTVRSSMQAWGGKFKQNAQDHERIVKATQYVEGASRSSGGRRSYVVLETEAGHCIVTEKLQDGMATWQEDPEDLEDRNVLAKVIRSSEDCSSIGSAVVRDLKGFQMKETRSFGLGLASPEKCQQYADAVYCTAISEAHHGVTSGYLLTKELRPRPAAPRASRSTKGKGKGKGKSKGRDPAAAVAAAGAGAGAAAAAA